MVYEHPFEELFNNFKMELSKDNNDDNHDLLIICQNDEIVQTKKSLLCLYSKVCRQIFDDIFSKERDMDFLSLPDFSKSCVEDVISIMKLEWSEETNFWSSEVLEICNLLEIQTGMFRLKQKSENHVNTYIVDETAESTKDDGITQQKPIVTASADQVSLASSNGRQPTHEQVIASESSEPSESKKIPEANCPLCSRVFPGNKKKDQLQSHIGIIHFHNEMLKEINHFFGNSNNCKDCGKVFTNQTLRKKHLVSNHSKYVEEIKKLVDQAFEAKKNQGVIRDNPEAQPIYQTSTVSNGSLHKCSFQDCDRKWEAKDNKLSIKLHLISHFNNEFSSHYNTHFKAGKCFKCPNSSASFKNTHIQNKHLFMKHQILVKEVEAKLKLIYNPVFEREKAKSPEKNILAEQNDLIEETVRDHQENFEDEEDLKSKGIEQVDTNTNSETSIEADNEGMSSDNSLQVQSEDVNEDKNSFGMDEVAKLSTQDIDDVDSLLADSDDEDDVQKILLEQNGSDSDDDDDDDDDDCISKRNKNLDAEGDDDCNMTRKNAKEIGQYTEMQIDTAEVRDNEESLDNHPPPNVENDKNYEEKEDNDNKQIGGVDDDNDINEDNDNNIDNDDDIEDDEDNDHLVEGEDIQNQLLMDQDISDDDDDSEDEDSRGEGDQDDFSLTRDRGEEMDTDTDKDNVNDHDELQQNLLEDQDISDDDMSDDE